MQYAWSTGPFDLAKQMGVVRGGEEHEAAIERIKKAAHANGKIAAIFCEYPSIYLFALFSVGLFSGPK